MADYYLEFSQVISDLTPAETQWLRHQLQHVYVFGDEEFPADALPADKWAAQADWSGIRAYADRDWCDSPEVLGFEFEFREQDEDHGRHLWLFAQDFGIPEKASHLVQKFLRTWRPRDCWTLSYAASCSKPRVDAFDGGAVFVTADEIKFFNSFDFLEEQRKQFGDRLQSTQTAP